MTQQEPPAVDFDLRETKQIKIIHDIHCKKMYQYHIQSTTGFGTKNMISQLDIKNTNLSVSLEVF